MSKQKVISKFNRTRPSGISDNDWNRLMNAVTIGISDEGDRYKHHGGELDAFGIETPKIYYGNFWDSFWHKNEINSMNQAELNRYQMELAKYEEEYNSIDNQMAQYREAGISPAMVYGTGSSFEPLSTSGYDVGTTEQDDSSFGQVVSMIPQLFNLARGVQEMSLAERSMKLAEKESASKIATSDLQNEFQRMTNTMRSFFTGDGTINVASNNASGQELLTFDEVLKRLDKNPNFIYNLPLEVREKLAQLDLLDKQSKSSEEGIKLTKENAALIKKQNELFKQYNLDEDVISNNKEILRIQKEFNESQLNMQLWDEEHQDNWLNTAGGRFVQNMANGILSGAVNLLTHRAPGVNNSGSYFPGPRNQYNFYGGYPY